jgi:c-di-GMP-binding flagellar brake protein YcgR
MDGRARKPFSWRPRPVTDHRPVLRLAQGARRWDVRLIGLPGRTRFLVTHPVDEGRLVFVKEGERFDVATFDGAVLVSFESGVQRVVLGETPALVLTLPPAGERRREPVRRTRRAPVVLPCSLRHGAGADALRAGFTGDLSEQGALVAVERPLPEGTTEVDLSLRIVSMGAPATLQLRATVRSSAPDPRPEAGATLLGLQFESIDPIVRLTISQYVGERLLAEMDDPFGAIR